MQITHEQAQKLVQRKMDRDLSAQENAVLSAHLRGCTDCEIYTNEMREVEQVLFPLLKRQWSGKPTPFSMTILKERNRKAGISTLLAMRRTALSLVVVAVFFSLWQFIVSSPSLSSQISPLVPPAPTPSTTSTNTVVTLEGCEMALYIVRANDTLPGIADQFSASIEQITEINQLGTLAVRPPMELLIPVCKSTPTGTVHPATFTTTYTPVIIKPTTSTPGGRY